MKKIEEIYWLRAYGCMAVFLFHLLDHVNQRVDNVATNLVRLPLVLGTPIFLFISIFVFAVRYGHTVPQGFLAQRVKYVMVPYFVYGVAYAGAEWARLRVGGETVGLVPYAVEYLLYAGWHGYFLIIAMQFYVAYWLFAHWRLWRFNPVPGLWIACLVSMGYWGLAYWLGVDPPGYLLWIMPFGWVYLFFLALALVRYYATTTDQAAGIQTKPSWIKRLEHPACLLGSIMLLVLATFMGWLEFSSKEVWVIPFFLLFTLWSMRWLRNRKAPWLVRQINVYSFGIYLAHPMFFQLVDTLVGPDKLPLAVYILLLAVIGLTGSILLNRCANLFSWGGVVMGKRLRVTA